MYKSRLCKPYLYSDKKTLEKVVKSVFIILVLKTALRESFERQRKVILTNDWSFEGGGGGAGRGI